MIDIAPIIQAVFALIAAVVTAFVIPFIKGKLSAVQRAELVKWVAVAVSAAEQIYIGDGKGKEKKAYVVEFLAGRGLTVDTDALDALIEAAVFGLKNKLEMLA